MQALMSTLPKYFLQAHLDIHAAIQHGEYQMIACRVHRNMIDMMSDASVV